MRFVCFSKHVWILALGDPRHVWVLMDNRCPCKHSVIKPLNKLLNEPIFLDVWVLLFSSPEAPARVFTALICQGNWITADLRLFSLHGGLLSGSFCFAITPWLTGSLQHNLTELRRVGMADGSSVWLREPGSLALRAVLERDPEGLVTWQLYWLRVDITPVRQVSGRFRVSHLVFSKAALGLSFCLANLSSTS